MFDGLKKDDDSATHSKSAHSRTWDIATSALSLIKKHDTAANPQAFAVWYAYAAKEKPDLNAAIDEILSQNLGISSADIMQMHELHLAETIDTEEKLETISQAIESTVAGAQSLVTEVISNTDEYVSSIDKTKDQLLPEASPEQIRGAIDGMLEKGQSSKQAAQNIQVALESTQKEITQLSSKVVQLRSNMMCDSVTKLINQYQFEELLKAKSAEAVANGYSLTVMVVNVKNIQELNTAAGMDISEFIMKTVSGMLKKAVGNKGICARFAGSKFAIMLPKCIYRDAGKVAKSIIDELQTFRIIKKPSDEFIGHIECYMGGSSLRPDMAPSDLIRSATEQAQLARQSEKSSVKFDLGQQRAA